MTLSEFLRNARSALFFAASDAGENPAPKDVMLNQVGHMALGLSGAYVLTREGFILAPLAVFGAALCWEAWQAATDGQWGLIRRRWDGVADLVAFGAGAAAYAYAEDLPSLAAPLACGALAVILGAWLGRPTA